MSNITFNKQEEAFELPYKLWGETRTVRFYVEAEADIMEHLSSVAEKLAKLDASRRQIAELLIDEGYYEGGDPDALSKKLILANPYVDFDEDDVTLCFDVSTDDGYMMSPAHAELFGEIFEVTGWVE